MNICMFTNTYLPHVGGVARSVSSFAEDLQKRGLNVMIVAPTFPTDEANVEDHNVLRVPAVQNFNGSDFSVRIPIPLFIDKKIDEFRPHVIHSHHPFLLGDAAFRAASRRDLPLVFTHHTLYEQYTHYVFPESKVMKRLAIEIATVYANLCTRVIAPSESIARLIRERGVKKPIEIIPTGVDVDFFRSGDGISFRNSQGIPEDAFVIGHLGRLAPEKNLQYLAEAVIKAFEELPENTVFLVVGSGPSEKSITDMFKDAGLEERLVMAGKRKGRELADAYRAMDLFVFSSKSETQGLVLVEAMAAEVPVIALDASGTRDILEDGENGRLLPENADTEQFARAIVDFFQNPHSGATWRKAAFETALKFSRDATAKKLIRLYQSLPANVSREGTGPEGTFPVWDELLKTMKAEWTLLTEKGDALLKSVLQEFNQQ
jgi:glycosyltransferase involved in cell wall biosynthesis